MRVQERSDRFFPSFISLRSEPEGGKKFKRDLFKYLNKYRCNQ